MDKRLNNIELRSSETQAIMNKKPPFAVRWGMTIILISLIGLIAFVLTVKRPAALYFLIDKILQEIR